MTVSEILQLAGYHVDDIIDAVDGGIAWLNEGLSALGANALLFGTTTIDALEVGTFYPLPANALDVMKVLDAAGDYYLGYNCQGNNISFADAGTYTVTYRRLPAPVSAVSDTPEVHQAFHPVLALFVASRFKSRNDDENPDSVRLMNEFAAGVGRVSSVLRRQVWKIPGNITVVR